MGCRDDCTCTVECRTVYLVGQCRTTLNSTGQHRTAQDNEGQLWTVQDRAKQCRSRIHERTISLRFLGIILRALIRKLLRRIRKEYFAAYMENMPIDIKLSLSYLKEFPYRKKNSDHKSPLKTWPNGQKIIRYCPFSDSVCLLPAPDPDSGISKPKRKKIQLSVSCERNRFRAVYSKIKTFVCV
jgi:hypothetical protein